MGKILWDLENKKNGFVNIKIGFRKLKSINFKRYKSFECIGEQQDDEGNKYETLQINYVPENLVPIIKQIFLQNDEDKILNVFQQLESLLEPNKEPSEVRLRGHIAEILFLLFLEKNNIDWTAYYVSEDNVFDLQTENYNIDIKSFTPDKSSIIVNDKQLLPSDKKKTIFICIELQITKNKKNILELIKSLKYTNSAVEKIKNEWANSNSSLLKITVDETNPICYLPGDCLPFIRIEPHKSFISADFKLSITFAKDNKINDYHFTSLEDLAKKLSCTKK